MWHLQYPDPWRNGFMESLNTWRFGGDWGVPIIHWRSVSQDPIQDFFFLSNNKNLCNPAGQQMLVPVSLKRCFLGEWGKRETTGAKMIVFLWLYKWSSCLFFSGFSISFEWFWQGFWVDEISARSKDVSTNMCFKLFIAKKGYDNFHGCFRRRSRWEARRMWAVLRPIDSCRRRHSSWGCDIGVIYFPTTWGAKEPQNLPNHREVRQFLDLEFMMRNFQSWVCGVLNWHSCTVIQGFASRVIFVQIRCWVYSHHSNSHLCIFKKQLVLRSHSWLFVYYLYPPKLNMSPEKGPKARARKGLRTSNKDFFRGYVWICMDMYGYVWICMDMYGYVWICRICMWFEEHPFAWFTCAFRWVASQIRLNDRIDSPRHSRRFKNLYRTNTTLQANSPLKSAICLTSFLSFNQPSESLGRFKDRIWNKNIRESWAVVMNFSNIAIGEAPKESDCIRKFDCSVVFALVFSLGSLHLPNVRWKSHIKI